MNKKIYLDNAATTHKPKTVLDAETVFYAKHNANIHRGVYALSEEATNLYDQARMTIAKFINAEPEEIIFTRGTTESLNFLAATISNLLQGRKEIVLTEMEHHANIVPWQQLAQKEKYTLTYIPITKQFTLDYAEAEHIITQKTALLSFAHTANALGTNNDAETLIRLAHKKGALAILDAAQSIPHKAIDVKKLDCDFLVFSGHKMLGPTGIGVLYGKKKHLENLPPFQYGGDMILKVTKQEATWADIPQRFEAGTPPIAQAIALAEAVCYLENIGLQTIETWEKELLQYAIEKLSAMKGVTLYTAGAEKSSGILSFNLEGVHIHDAASLLADKGVCIRGGTHCAMPLMDALDIPGTLRASFYLYNTFEDIDALAEAIKQAQKVFR